MSQPTFRKLFVANRGEVAVRIARACDKLGIVPVFGVSEADQDAPYIRNRESILLGPARSKDSYLNVRRVVEAAKETRCSALHPGWGFLSENPLFASLCETHGVTFIGPPAHVMFKMGRKTPAKIEMRRYGLSLIPGSPGALRDSAHALHVALDVGFPVLFKAENGGGGRGMRVAKDESEVARAYEDARQEAQAAFGDASVYLETLVECSRHVEVQVIADRYGNVAHLGERDCTIQRNHQKLLEESPCVVLSDVERERVVLAAANAVKRVGYVGAGTLEFLLDSSGTLRFMEMNTRLQVEHGVTEMRTGVDLVVEQIRVAAGHPLSFSQKEVRFGGHTMECRINAEDPQNGFRPDPGTIQKWELPRDEEGRVRVDTHVEEGYTVKPFYDSLIAKIMVKGETRDDASRVMVKALGALRCEGISTTAPMHQAILQSDAFRANQYVTGTIPGWDQ